jgi:hypothetical protein
LLQPFSAHAVLEHREPGRVAARPCQARDETGADRIDDGHEHDRHSAGGLQQRRRGCSPGRTHEDVRRQCSQFRRLPAQVVGVGRGASVDPQVAAVAPAQLLQGLCERREAGLSFRVFRGPIREHADAPHLLALLRTRRERPRRRRAAEQRDERAAVDSIN